MQNSKKEVKKTKPLKELFEGLGLLQIVLTEILTCSILGMGLGYLIFKQLGWNRFWVLFFGLLGLVLGVYRLYLLNLKISSMNEKQSNEKTEKT